MDERLFADGRSRKSFDGAFVNPRADSSTPGVARWVAAIFDRTESWLPDMPGLDPDVVPLRVLAIYHVVAGYFASAATYRALTGRDLHSPRAVEEQIRIVTEISEALFAGLSERPAQERV